jgi:transcription elongation GreA/GreB family factor
MLLKETKILLFKACSQIVEQKINTFKNALTEAQEAANNETKSSAGDKHETGRAMAQLETEKLTAQFTEASKLAQTLNQIDISLIHDTVRLGSLIKTNHGNFFIAVSLGKVNVGNADYFVISTISPIGKQLLGLKQNNAFTFNDRGYVIEEIF